MINASLRLTRLLIKISKKSTYGERGSMVCHNLRMAMIRKQKKICPNSRARMEEFGSHAEMAQLVAQLTCNQ